MDGYELLANIMDLATSVLKTGLINQANGSSYIETGKVKIACAVYVLLLAFYEEAAELSTRTDMDPVKVNHLSVRKAS